MSVNSTYESMSHNTGFRVTQVKKDRDPHYTNILHATDMPWRIPTPQGDAEVLSNLTPRDEPQDV